MAFYASASHVGFANSLNLLYPFVLTNFIEGSENLVKNVDNLVLTLVDNIRKITDVTEHDCYLSHVIGHEVL